MGNLVGWGVGVRSYMVKRSICLGGGVGDQFDHDSREGLSFSRGGYLVLEPGSEWRFIQLNRRSWCLLVLLKGWNQV